jgi:hypothetical protein
MVREVGVSSLFALTAKVNESLLRKPHHHLQVIDDHKHPWDSLLVSVLKTKESRTRRSIEEDFCQAMMSLVIPLFQIK